MAPMVDSDYKATQQDHTLIGFQHLRYEIGSGLIHLNEIVSPLFGGRKAVSLIFEPEIKCYSKKEKQKTLRI